MLKPVLLLTGNSLIGLVLLCAALLRENPRFWRNAGGYPVALRELVRSGFPCLLVMDVVFVAAATLMLVRRRHAWPELARIGFLVALAQWLLLGVVTGVAVHNNLENLWEGRPLHWKPGP